MASAPDDPKVQHDISARKKLGLRNDAEYVRGLRESKRQGKLVEGDESLDMLLTKDEKHEMDERADVSQQRPQVSEYFTGQPTDIYAGNYLDQAAGGRLIVLVTRDRDRVDSDLKAMGIAPGRLEVRSAGSSYQRLNEVFQGIGGRRGELADDGIDVSTVAIEEALNGISVGVSGDVSNAKKQLSSDYPDVTLVVKKERGVSTDGVLNVNPPFRGGTGITNNSEGLGCTNGFTGYRNTVPATYYVLTAGHCGRIVQPSNIFSQYTTRIGPMDVRSYGLNVPADAGRIRIEDATKRSNGLVLGPNNTIPITSRAAVGTGGTGDYVCISTTRYVDTDGDMLNCGTILNGSFDYKSHDDWNVQFSSSYGRLTDLGCTSGDSGAPVFYANMAYGLHSGRTLDTNQCIFGHIYDVLRSTDVANVYFG